MQDALKLGDNAKGLQHLFAPDRADQANGPKPSTKSKIQGMLLYHPILLESPWQAPDDLDKHMDDLMLTNEPHLVARSMK